MSTQLKNVLKVLGIVLGIVLTVVLLVILMNWVRNTFNKPVEVPAESKAIATQDPLLISLATQVAELKNNTVSVVEKKDSLVAPKIGQQDCPKAADLGPWAPNGSSGENFEVTCNETVCNLTHVQLWWPAGSGQPWGKQEISVMIPKGLSIEVQQGAGRGWEYPLGCSLDEIQQQIMADNARRKTDTSFYGQVDINDLIKTGLVVVRFDRRGAVNPTP